MSITKEFKQSDTLVVACTGLAHKLNLPVDLFFQAAGLSGCSRIVLSDITKRMTLGGIAPEYPSFAELVEYLQKEVSSYSPKLLITVGTSGGAHTALLLGHLLKVNYAVAFAPYPYLSIDEMKKRKDPTLNSMWPVIEMLDCLPDQIKSYLDLRNVLITSNNFTHYDVHVSQYHKWDYRRSKYLEGLPNLSVFHHPYTCHSTASSLARDKLLKECFEFPYTSYNRIQLAHTWLKNLAKSFTQCFIHLPQ